MVEQADVDQGERLLQARGDRPVRGAGLGAAGRMVVAVMLYGHLNVSSGYPMAPVLVKKALQGDGFKAYLTQNGVLRVLPALWAEELRLGSRPNSVEAHLRDVAVLYRWGERTGVRFEEKFSQLNALTGPEIKQIAECLCKKEDGSLASAATCRRRLASIRSYIEFCFEYFVEIRRASLSDQAQADKNRKSVIRKLVKQVQFATSRAANAVPSTDLTDDELELIESVLHPSSELNPWKSHPVRVRNYCIFHVTLATLARRGEIALLEISDLKLGVTPTITIKAPGPNSQQKRRDGASLKTLGREVPIKSQLASLLDEYVNEFREPLLRPKVATAALFVSARDGRRISAYTVNQILDKVESIPEIANLKKRLHPHGLRSTAANRVRREIARKGPTAAIDVAEALSYMGGWVQGSPMVQRYTRSAIAERLGEILRTQNHQRRAARK